MDFENSRRKLTQLAKQWAETDAINMEAIENIEMEASVCLLQYCIANNETINGIDFNKLLELEEDAGDYEDNFNARHEFISQVYYKDEYPYIDENISKNVQQLAAYFFEKQA